MGRSKQLATLIDSAPSTLDTLNELAAALGDDANFSTTVTNSIATKLPLTGGTLTGTLQVEHGTTAEYVNSIKNTGDNLQLLLGTTTGGLLNIQGKTINSNAAYQISLQAEGGNVGIGTTLSLIHISEPTRPY